MEDDKFKEAVLAQLAAIVSRLDDQDITHDLLVGKVDRYAANTAAALEAAEQALNRTTTLSRRVSSLENPGSK
ncbi:MAG: hypothetical protein AAF755_11570 [Pseudomonadota bacterium]